MVPTPRVLGVDDFALRRGQRYATILLDLEQRWPIDVLPGRDREPLAIWLQAHAGVQVLVRDRAEAYGRVAGRLAAATWRSCIGNWKPRAATSAIP